MEGMASLKCARPEVENFLECLPMRISKAIHILIDPNSGRSITSSFFLGIADNNPDIGFILQYCTTDPPSLTTELHSLLLVWKSFSIKGLPTYSVSLIDELST